MSSLGLGAAEEGFWVVCGWRNAMDAAWLGLCVVPVLPFVGVKGGAAVAASAEAAAERGVVHSGISNMAISQIVESWKSRWTVRVRLVVAWRYIYRCIQSQTQPGDSRDTASRGARALARHVAVSEMPLYVLGACG